MCSPRRRAARQARCTAPHQRRSTTTRRLSSRQTRRSTVQPSLGGARPARRAAPPWRRAAAAQPAPPARRASGPRRQLQVRAARGRRQPNSAGGVLRLLWCATLPTPPGPARAAAYGAAADGHARYAAGKAALLVHATWARAREPRQVGPATVAAPASRRSQKPTFPRPARAAGLPQPRSGAWSTRAPRSRCAKPPPVAQAGRTNLRAEIARRCAPARQRCSSLALSCSASRAGVDRKLRARVCAAAAALASAAGRANLLFHALTLLRTAPAAPGLHRRRERRARAPWPELALRVAGGFVLRGAETAPRSARCTCLIGIVGDTPGLLGKAVG